MSSPTNLHPSPLTAYFDRAYPVCATEIGHYRRQARAEAWVWVDAASRAEGELGPGLHRDAALRRFHVRRANERLVDGMRGFATLWTTMPRFARLGRIALIDPLPPVFEAAYRVFLAVRLLCRKLTRWSGTHPSR